MHDIRGILCRIAGTSSTAHDNSLELCNSCFKSEYVIILQLNGRLEFPVRIRQSLLGFEISVPGTMWQHNHNRNHNDINQNKEKGRNNNRDN